MEFLKNLLLFLGCALVCTACGSQQRRECPPVMSRAILTETEALRRYIDQKGIVAQEDSLGYFYTIEKPGTGPAPNPCSDVTVDYEGRLTDGTPFDAAQNISFNLSQLITGWQMGLPKIGAGGTITLYLPPSLGYGDAATGDIPAQSILIFKIKLHRVR